MPRSSRVGSDRSARASVYGWWVSPAPSPHPALHVSCCCCGCPGCGDAAAPITVSGDWHLVASEQDCSVVADLPVGDVATDERFPVQPDVSFAYPADHSPPGEIAEIAERAFGHAEPEILAPSSQHRIQPG